MKTRIWITLLAVCSFTSTQAQLSIAADMSWPQGDFGDLYSFGVGPGLGYDLGLGGGTIVIFGQASYHFMFTSEDEVTNAFMIPYQAGLKLNFGGDPQGLYAFCLLGGHSLGYKVEFAGFEESYSSNLFSWGLGGGFRTNGKLDLAVRYNAISKDPDIDGSEASSYIGLRVGLVLGGRD